MPTPYCPFRHFPHPVAQVGFVRLACLIHAANVRSEPGSNPSKVCAHGGTSPPPQSAAPRRKAEAGGRKAQPKRLRSPLLGRLKELVAAAAEAAAGEDASAVQRLPHPRFGSWCSPSCQRPSRLPLHGSPAIWQKVRRVPVAKDSGSSTFFGRRIVALKREHPLLVGRGCSQIPGDDRLSPSTDYHGPRMLNGRVRDGNGWGHPGVLTEKAQVYTRGERQTSPSCRPLVGRGGGSMRRSVRLLVPVR